MPDLEVRACDDAVRACLCWALRCAFCSADIRDHLMEGVLAVLET